MKVSKDKSTVEEVLAIVEAHRTRPIRFEPKGLMPVVQFMNKTGAIKVMPASWKDMFFSDAFRWR